MSQYYFHYLLVDAKKISDVGGNEKLMSPFQNQNRNDDAMEKKKIPNKLTAGNFLKKMRFIEDVLVGNNKFQKFVLLM